MKCLLHKKKENHRLFTHLTHSFFLPLLRCMSFRQQAPSFISSIDC